MRVYPPITAASNIAAASGDRPSTRLKKSKNILEFHNEFSQNLLKLVLKFSEILNHLDCLNLC